MQDHPRHRQLGPGAAGLKQPAGRTWRIAFVDADPVLVERTRASLGGGPFHFLDLRAPPAPGQADLQLLDAAALDPAGPRDGAVPFIAYGPAPLLRTAWLCGCLDYLRDPWTPEELSLRARAALARVPARQLFPWGELRLEGCALRGPGGTAVLTPRGARILAQLLASRGRPVPRQALELRGWGTPRRRGSRALDAQVSAIRGKLRAAFPAAGPRCITAVRGEGYLIR